MEVSKSISLFFEPISTCDFGLKENFFIFPTLLITLFDFSSLPIGTSLCAKFGKKCNKLLISF